MHPNEIRLWKKGVDEYNNILQNLKSDKAKLEELMIDHLKCIFDDWENITFSPDFEVIKIVFPPNHVLDNDALSNVGMKWEVIATVNLNGNITNGIKVYPFKGE